MPIEGMEAYRSGMDTMANLIIAAGPDNKDFANWTEEQQTTFWTNAKAASEAIAQEIVDYCIANGYNAEGDPVEACAANWGFELPKGATIEDFGATMMEAYGNDIATLVSTENAGSSITDVFPGWEDYSVGIETGASAANISGFQKTGDYSMRVVATQVDATLIYQLTLAISPLHYYGDKEQFDYDNNSFGFPKGDLSSVRAKTTQPLGAGPYKFVKFENGVVNFEANENYFKGTPKTKFVNFQEGSDADKLNGVVTDFFDFRQRAFNYVIV
jgi:peptide/nickel transport system substrate-binding protein